MTVVVSPLVSLMEDQVNVLVEIIRDGLFLDFRADVCRRSCSLGIRVMNLGADWYSRCTYEPIT